MYIYISDHCEPVHNMHEAKRSQEKNDTGNIRTSGRILRAAVSNASNGCASRLGTRTTLFDNAARPGSIGTCRAFCGFAVARAETSEHFSALGQFRVAPIEHAVVQARLERHFSSNYFAAPEQGRSRHFEPSAAPRRVRAAVSSPSGHFEQLVRAARFTFALEQPFQLFSKA